ncbi:alpha/beta hydrolase [Bacillus sp. CGMCC 1.60114]|uniref:alpha/beta hydrolase n=1 Tax=unclassified Bacillus (in: firmicutes) TaxID=185979 RepID=UPI00363C2117
MSFQADSLLKTAISTVLFPFTAVNMYIRKKNATKEPGSIVNVDGRNVHTMISGEENGNPTVILDAGLSGNCLAWCLVQPELSKFTRVVSFDRAGYGWSDTRSGLSTSQEVVNDLKIALEKMQIAPPYILVAHSFAGLNMRLFASQYPDEVEGIVLVDAVHENRYLKEEMNEERLQQYVKSVKQMRLGYITSTIGLPRLLKMPVGGRSLPAQVQDHVKHVGYTAGAYEAVYKEMLYSEESAKQVKRANSLRENLPVIVISSNNSDPTWKELQQLLCQLTNCTKHIQTENGHSIQLENPEVVIKTILERM